MLVLTRRVGERVAVGPVVIEVVEVQRARVRFAILAPQGVKILRRELAPQVGGPAPARERWLPAAVP